MKQYVLMALVIFLLPTAALSDNRENALQALVMLTTTADEDYENFGAGIIVGDDANWIYIATAAHVVWDRDENRMLDITAEFKQLPGKNAPVELAVDFKSNTDAVSSTPPSINLNEDFAVLKVRKDALQTIAMPKIRRIFEGEKIQQVQFIGRKSLQQLWRSTPLFEVVDPSKLVEPKRHEMVAKTFFELAAFSGGGVFDSEWRLAGMTIEGGAQSQSFEVDELTTLNRIDWIAAELKRLAIPMAPYLLNQNEGPLPPETAMRELPRVSGMLLPDGLGAKLNLVSQVFSGGSIENVDFHIYAKAKNQNWFLLGSESVESIHAGHQKMHLIPKGISDIFVCHSNTLKNGGYGVGMFQIRDISYPFNLQDMVSEGSKNYRYYQPQYSIRENPCRYTVEAEGISVASVKEESVVKDSSVNPNNLPHLIDKIFLGIDVNPISRESYSNAPMTERESKFQAKLHYDVPRAIKENGYTAFLKINDSQFVIDLLPKNAVLQVRDIVGTFPKLKVGAVNSISVCSTWQKDDEWFSVTANYDAQSPSKRSSALRSIIYAKEFSINASDFKVGQSKNKFSSCGIKKSSLQKLTSSSSRF